MKLQHILPAGGLETVSALPAPYRGPDGFLLRADVYSEADFEALLSGLLEEAESEWPASWNGVIDQFCDEELGERWTKIELVLGVSDATPFLYFLNLLTVLTTIAEYHPHWTVKLSVWTP